MTGVTRATSWSSVAWVSGPMRMKVSAMVSRDCRTQSKGRARIRRVTSFTAAQMERHDTQGGC